MIDVIIASYNEPKATLRAVNTFLNQYPGKDMRVTVVDPFPEVEEFLTKNIKDKRFVFYPDPGEGKAYALNLLFQEYASSNTDDIFILTDGDVYVSDNTVKQIAKTFENKKIGCVTCQPVALDPLKSKFEYWSEIAFKGIDKARKKLSAQQKFFECSGYLFAIRKAVILDFPMETSEDSIIPYLFWKKKYKIKYLPQVKVYVKNPNNWKDYLNQKIRNIKAHENLTKLAPNMPRTKSLFNEIKNGALFAIQQPKTLKQFSWAIQLYFARLYIYLRAFKELKKKKTYGDGWRETEIESTKPLD